MTDLAKLAQSLAVQADLLSAANSMPATGEKTARDEVVCALLKRASDLSRGASAVGGLGKSAPLGVLARAILENFILILWIVISDANALEHKQAGLRELSRMLRINLENGKARIRKRDSGEDATAEFLSSGRLDNLVKRRPVEVLAREAGIEDLYNVFYRFLSLDLHGHGAALSGDEENEASCIHMQGIGAICKATGHVGVRWLLRRERTDNETLRTLLGLRD